MISLSEVMDESIFNDEEFLSKLSDPNEEENCLKEIRSLLDDQFRFQKRTKPEIYERLKNESQRLRVKSALSFVLFSYYAELKDFKKANDYINDAHNFIVFEYKLSDELKNHTYHLFKAGSTSYILTIVGMARVVKILKYEYLKNETITKETRNYKEIFRIIPFFVPNIHECSDYYIEMDFIDGYTLAEYRDRELWNDHDSLVSQTKRIIVNLCRNLRQLADRGILHKDLTPDNIIIRETNNNHLEVFLIDFGYNYVLSQRIRSNIEFLSAQKYIAPEVVADPQNATTKSDCYSVGLILLETLYRDSLNIINLEKAIDSVRQEYLDLANLIESMIEQDPKARLKEFVVPLNIKHEDQAEIYDKIIDEVNLQFTLYEKVYHQDHNKPILAKILKIIGDFILTNISKVGNLFKEISELKAFSDNGYKSRMEEIRFWSIVCQVCHAIILISFIAKIKGEIVGLTGMLVALSFSFAATKYYMNIFSRIWLSDIAKTTHWGIRWTSFFFVFPILYLILINPDHWPYASSLGVTAIPVNNFLTYFFVKRNIRDSIKSEKQDLLTTKVDADRILFRDEYIAWGWVTVIFFPALALTGFLLDKGILHDKTAYAVITLGVIWKMYFFNCTFPANSIRTGLEREINIARRNKIPQAQW